MLMRTVKNLWKKKVAKLKTGNCHDYQCASWETKRCRGKMFHVHLPSGRNGLKEEL